MPGLVPGIHVFFSQPETRRGWSEPARPRRKRCRSPRSFVEIIYVRCRERIAHFVLWAIGTTKEEPAYVKNLPLPVVRRRGRGGREFVRFAAAGFQDREGAEEHRRQPRRK